MKIGRVPFNPDTKTKLDIPAKVTDDGKGNFNVEFSPEVGGPVTIDVTLGAAPIAGSPFTTDAVPAGTL